MSLNQILPTTTTNPPMVSLMETRDHYMVALDLPTLPSTGNRIRVTDSELCVEGVLNGELTKLLSCLSTNHHVKAIYEKGVLWLTLPKSTTLQNQPVLAAI